MGCGKSRVIDSVSSTKPAKSSTTPGQTPSHEPVETARPTDTGGAINYVPSGPVWEDFPAPPREELRDSWTIRETVAFEGSCGLFKVEQIANRNERGYLRILPLDGNSQRSIKNKFEILTAMQSRTSFLLRYKLVEESHSHLYLLMDSSGCSETIVEARHRQKVQLTETAIHKLMSGIFETLLSLHSEGIVHGQITPHKILYNPDNQRCYLYDVLPSFEYSSELLLSANVAYLSPQAAVGSTITCETDVWALGATLYYLVAGSHKPLHRYIQAHMQNSGNPELEFPDSVWNQVSPQLRALVSKMLAPVPLRRISIIGALSDPWFQSQHLSMPLMISEAGLQKQRFREAVHKVVQLAAQKVNDAEVRKHKLKLAELSQGTRFVSFGNFVDETLGAEISNQEHFDAFHDLPIDYPLSLSSSLPLLCLLFSRH